MSSLISKHHARNVPGILKLNDTEKIHDDEGRIYEIETRGDRDAIMYFKASDIKAMLEIDDINDILQDKHFSFIYSKDYEIFNNSKHTKYDTPVLYLTYAGLVRLLFVRKHPIAKKFQRWATETLFTASLGTPEAKKELAGKLLGVELCDIKAFLATDTDIMPVIYLFVIGRIGDLRKEMKIDTAGTFDDTGLVAKFGYTTNLRDRAADHYRTYGKIPGTRVYLRCYTRIEPAHLSKAESALREYFKRCECLITDNKTHKELVVLDEKFVERKIKTVYKDIGKLYEGRCAETRKLDEGIDKMIDIQDKIVTNQQISHDKLFSTSDKLIAMYEKRLAEKDAKIAKRDAKLAEKDIIIKNLTSRLSFNA